MKFTRPFSQALPAIPAKANDEVVELSLPNGMEHEALHDLFVDLWVKDKFRVTLDCSHVAHLTLPEVLTLVRFSNEFSCRGGFVRLTKVNSGVRSQLQDLHWTYLLAVGTRAAKRSGVLVGRQRIHAR